MIANKKEKALKKVIITIIIIIICGIIIAFGGKVLLKIYYPNNYEEYVSKYAEKYEIEEAWIYALIKAESNFEKESISKSGAVGLMQLMEKTAEEMAKEIRNRI